MKLKFIIFILFVSVFLVDADLDEENELDLVLRGKNSKIYTKPYYGKCGVRYVEKTKKKKKTKGASFHRIIGGKKATVGEFPWQVKIMKNGLMSCGGTIIDERTIVTAAHCFATSNCYAAPNRARFLEILDNTDADHNDKVRKLKECEYEPAGQFSVHAGVTDTYSRETQQTQQVSRVSKVYVTESYITYAKSRNPALHNDVAVLILQRPFKFNTVVRPACLPDASLVLNPGQILTVTGFGHMEEGAAYTSPRMMEADVELFSAEQCDSFYDDVVSDRMFCAGTRGGGVDACQGDSGGPIGINNKADNRFTLVGVVSFGYGCGRKKYPGVYTDLRHFLDFVENARKGKIEPVAKL